MVTIIVALVTLVLGGLAGYFIFRYVIKGKYNEMIDAANKEAEVVKEKKLLEVKEKFLNKKLNWRRRCSSATHAFSRVRTS